MSVNYKENSRCDTESRMRSQPTLRKEIGLFDAVSIVAGTIIGSGIFLIPSSIGLVLTSLGAVLLVWVLGGILTVFGALSLAELGSLFPGTGGLCVYLRQAYGPLPAFLYAWSLLFIIHSGSIAALAVAFSLYLGQIIPLNTLDEKILSAACILVLTTINCLGIREGKLMQNAVATAKLSGLAMVIVLLWFKGSRPIHLFEISRTTTGHAHPVAEFGVALIAVLWAYEAWHVVSFVAGEMKRPTLDLPRSLVIGTSIVMLAYVAANLGYYHTLSSAEIRGNEAVAASAIERVCGSTARASISILILVSILGSMNGMVLTGPRAYFAMAQDGIFPRPFSRISHRYKTPMFALIAQGVWAALLAVSNSYQELFTDVIFVAWIFYGLAVAGVLVLRRTQPQLARPFRVPGYPWVCLIFCATAAALVVNTVCERTRNALIGLALVVCGIPVYLFLIRSSVSLNPEC
jgi:APA family basic amino acid/polyamine antiporter